MIFDGIILTFFVISDALRLPDSRNCELSILTHISLLKLPMKLPAKLPLNTDTVIQFIDRTSPYSNLKMTTDRAPDVTGFRTAFTRDQGFDVRQFEAHFCLPAPWMVEVTKKEQESR